MSEEIVEDYTKVTVEIEENVSIKAEVDDSDPEIPLADFKSDDRGDTRFIKVEPNESKPIQVGPSKSSNVSDSGSIDKHSKAHVCPECDRAFPYKNEEGEPGLSCSHLHAVSSARHSPSHQDLEHGQSHRQSEEGSSGDQSQAGPYDQRSANQRAHPSREHRRRNDFVMRGRRQLSPVLESMINRDRAKMKYLNTKRRYYELKRELLAAAQNTSPRIQPEVEPEGDSSSTDESL